jgi:hypothetical protein
MVDWARACINQETVECDSLPGYGPVIFVKRLVRTRMLGVMGAGGEKPPATRLGADLTDGRSYRNVQEFLRHGLESPGFLNID